MTASALSQLATSPSSTALQAQEHISADFPFESRFVDVLGSKMHYIEQGEGDPILFIHGNPASSYLWRNVIPHVSAQGRCIALDLMGMGRSDKPDLDYTYDDHLRYLDAFIEALGIGQNLTLVIHDWGSMLGFRWAADNAEKVRAIAFMEAMVRPLSYADLPGSLKIGMRVMRNPFFNWLMVGVGNVFLGPLLADLVHRPMDPAVKEAWRSPFPTIASRKAVRMFPRQVPFDGFPERSYAHVTGYIEWIAQAEIPMLMFHGDEGVAIKADEVAWCRDNITHLDVVDLGPGKHFLQETHPDRIGTEIARWFSRL